jgi:hypothetical protein
MDETHYDLVFPIPREVERQTPAQQWWVAEQKTGTGDNYTEGDWLLNGTVHIFCGDTSIYSCMVAELRFGKHPYMQSCEPLCLAAVDFEGDDKHLFENLRADYASKTLCGTVHGHTAVFCPCPFQMSRLRRLLDAMYNKHNHSDRGLCALISECLRYYQGLLDVSTSEAEHDAGAAEKKRSKK